jgi:hypothetical protein
MRAYAFKIPQKGRSIKPLLANLFYVILASKYLGIKKLKKEMAEA